MRGDVLFTLKAEDEMARDDLDEDLVCEAIINAPGIAKRLRSANPNLSLAGQCFCGAGSKSLEIVTRRDERSLGRPQNTPLFSQ